MPDRVQLAETLVALLRERAQAQPDRTGYVHLRDGRNEESLAYGEFDRRARVVGAMLQSRLRPGERVLICLGPGLDYLAAFFGCLYAGAVAVPVYPPRFTQKLERLVRVVEDATPSMALTSSSISATLQPLLAGNPSLAALDWVEMDAAGTFAAADWREPELSSSAVAFLQYTSGSIASPKGVVLTHGNLMANLASIRDMFAAHEGSKAVSWLPQYHDMGLIGMMLGSLYTSVPVAFMSPFTFVQRPARWLQAISRFGATISGGPNFAYDLCLRRITDEQLEGVDLSSWQNAFCGAEPISLNVLNAFAERFGPLGFRAEAFHPCYGMAEASLAISGGLTGKGAIALTVDSGTMEQEKRVVLKDVRGPGARAYVGCGKPARFHDVRIVDVTTRQNRAEGEIGEIWFAGPSVGGGYWNRPHESSETFAVALAEDDGAGARYLRTGDLGFLQHGELFVTGRIKEVMILLGRNIYPRDIERTAATGHPAVGGTVSAAFSVERGQEERLVLVQEVDRSCRDEDLEPIATSILERIVEDHGVRPFAVSLVRPNSIPMTSSGKVQRLQTRLQFLEGKLAEKFRFQEAAH